MAAARPRSKRRFGRTRRTVRVLGWLVSGVLALVVLAWLVLPLAVRWTVTDTLAGFGVPASVEGARVDLAGQTVTLLGLRIGEVDRPGVHWDEIAAEIDLGALVAGRVRIVSLRLSEARLDVARLRETRWSAPDAAPGAGAPSGWEVEVVEVAVDGARFVWLSERLARPVIVHSLRLRRPSELAAGGEMPFELRAAVGEAPVRLEGSARLREGNPEADGRYRVDGVRLAGLGDVLREGQAELDGRLHGAGEFEVRYDPEPGAASIRLAGRASVEGLRAALPEARLLRGDADWDGEIRVTLPVLAAARVDADGRVDVRDVALERSVAPAIRAQVRELGWTGHVRAGASLDARGEVELGGLRLEGDAPEGAWTGRAARARWSVRHHRAEGSTGVSHRFESLHATEIALGPEAGGPFPSMSASELDAQGLFLGADGAIGAARVTVDGLEGEHGGDGPRAAWTASGVDATGVSGALDGPVVVERVELAAATHVGDARDGDARDGDARKVRLSGVAVTGASVETGSVAIGAGEAWIESVHLGLDAAEVWGTGLYARDVTFAGETIELGRAEAATLRAAAADAAEVDLTALALDSVEILAPDSVRAGVVEAESAGWGGPEGLVVEAVRAEDASWTGPEEGVRVATASVGSLRHGTPEIGLLRAGELASEGIAWAPPDGLLAGSVSAGEVEWVVAGGELVTVAGVALRGLDGTLAEGGTVEGIASDSVAYSSAGGEAQIAGLAVESLRAAASGSVSADAVRGETLRYAIPGLGDGTAGPLAVRALGFAPPVMLGADAIRVDAIAHRDADGREAALDTLALDAISTREDGFRVAERIVAQGASAADPVNGATLALATGTIAAPEIGPGGAAKAARIELDEPVLGAQSEERPLLAPARVVAEEASFVPGTLLDLGRVRVEALRGGAGLDTDGRVVYPRLPFVGAGETTDARLAIAIEHLSTAQGGRFRLFDEAVDPPFRRELSPFEVLVEDLHTGDPARRGRFRVAGRIDEFSGLEASGTMGAREDGRVDVDLTAKLSGLDLSRISARAAKHAGLAIASGRADADVTLAVHGDELDGMLELLLSKVEFESAEVLPMIDTPEGKMPLDTAFGLLQDKKGTVRLEVPIAGSLDAPDLDFKSDAMGQIVGTAVKKAVGTAVLLPLGPLGVIISATGGLLGGGGELALEPIEFPPGSIDLPAESFTRLDALAEQLGEHPKMRVRICGRAVPADARANAKRRAEAAAGQGQPAGRPLALAQLARARGLVARRYVEQKHLIPARQVIACDPKVEDEEDSPPRVDLQIVVGKEGAEPKVAPETSAKPAS